METERAINSRRSDRGSSGREKLLWRVLKAIIALVAWSAAIFAVVSLYQDSTNRIGYDFYQFWVGGDVLRIGEATGHGQPIDLYSDAAFRDIAKQYQDLARTHSPRQREAAAVWPVLYTASTPFFYWVFSVATPGDYDRMFNDYRIVSLACLVASIMAVAWRLRYSIAGIGAAVALAALSAPVQSDFFVTNINCPQLAACLGYLFLRDWARRAPAFSWLLQMTAGLLMGMLVAFKPNLLLAPLLLGFAGLVSGRQRAASAEAGGLAFGLVGAVGISSWKFGSLSCWREWVRVIRGLGSQLSMPSGYGNISLSRTLFELTGRNFFEVLASFFILLAIAAIWLGRRSARVDAEPSAGGPMQSEESSPRDLEFRHDLTLFGIAQTITFMVSGLAWLHYPILIFPFLMLAVSRQLATQMARTSEIARYLLAAIVILLLMIPPAKPLEWFYSIRLEISSSTWVRCTQIAVIVSFGIGLWFESRILRRPRT